MIKFNNLRLSEDRKTLQINAEIESGASTTGFYIKDIYVEYYKNRTATLAPSVHALHAWANTDTTKRSTGDISVSSDSLSKTINGTSTFVGGLFYVIVVCSNTETEPDLVSDVGAVLDYKAVYEIGMRAVSVMVKHCTKDRCEQPLYLEQFILAYHSLELAIAAKDMEMMDKLWAKCIDGNGGLYGSTCNCG